MYYLNICWSEPMEVIDIGWTPQCDNELHIMYIPTV